MKTREIVRRIIDISLTCGVFGLVLYVTIVMRTPPAPPIASEPAASRQALR
ncbi:hypothetical protein [Acinetobacter nosocomialis]|uniref:hypothetical protein n=1 Tax=Acinetobacter nosocomialis TaxID=106654 RepID=UPI0013D5A06E|nr:hypothetical protein [Acinetobacter nosocomialis]